MDINHTLHTIIILTPLVIIALLVFWPIIKKEKCDHCNSKMKRKLNNRHIVFICPDCGRKTDTGFFLGRAS